MLYRRTHLTHKLVDWTSKDRKYYLFHATGIRKKVDVAILYSNKNELQASSDQKRQKSQFIFVTRTAKKEEVTIFNIYAVNNSAPNFIKQVLLE